MWWVHEYIRMDVIAKHYHTRICITPIPHASRKLGYVKLREFNSRAKQKVQAAVAALETQGTQSADG